MSWCKYIQRDLFLLNNPRFSFWTADAFAYSMWKAACPLLPDELDRIIEISEKIQSDLVASQGNFLTTYSIWEETTVFLRSCTKCWPSQTAQVPGSKVPHGVFPSQHLEDGAGVWGPFGRWKKYLRGYYKIALLGNRRW